MAKKRHYDLHVTRYKLHKIGIDSIEDFDELDVDTRMES